MRVCVVCVCVCVACVFVCVCVVCVCVCVCVCACACVCVVCMCVCVRGGGYIITTTQTADKVVERQRRCRQVLRVHGKTTIGGSLSDVTILATIPVCVRITTEWANSNKPNSF